MSISKKFKNVFSRLLALENGGGGAGSSVIELNAYYDDGFHLTNPASLQTLISKFNSGDNVSCAFVEHDDEGNVRSRFNSVAIGFEENKYFISFSNSTLGGDYGLTIPHMVVNIMIDAQDPSQYEIGAHSVTLN